MSHSTNRRTPSKSTSWTNSSSNPMPIMQAKRYNSCDFCSELKNSFDGTTFMLVWVCRNGLHSISNLDHSYLKLAINFVCVFALMKFADAGAVCAAHTAWMTVNTETTRVQIVEHMLAHTKTNQTIDGWNNQYSPGRPEFSCHKIFEI